MPGPVGEGGALLVGLPPPASALLSELVWYIGVLLAVFFFVYQLILNFTI